LIEERVLALDMSTKTGWAVFVSSDKGCDLECYGQVKQIPEIEGIYPGNFVEWAHRCFDEILKLVDAHAPDVLVIEETASNSKSVYSQKILEWIHYLVAKFIKESNIKVMYIMTGQWKSETEAKISKSESKHNKEVKTYKEKHGTNIAYGKDGKRVGKITRKHVASRRSNEIFAKFLQTPLRKKDEDAAESLLLGYCYHLRRMKQNDQKSVVD
jgi:hypothetical protein